MYREKWYEKTWVVVLFLIFLFPVGAIIMWGNKYEWEGKTKKVVTIVGSFLFACALIMIFVPSKNDTQVTTASNVSSKKEDSTEEKKELKIYYFSALNSDGVVGSTINFNCSINEVGSVQYQFSYSKDGKTVVAQDYSTNKNFSWVPTEPGYYAFYMTIKNDDGKEIKSSSVSVKIISKEEYEAQAAQKAQEESERQKAQEEANRQKAQAEAEARARSKASTECKNALEKAKTYSQVMHMSKRKLYEQLTSQYGEKFTADAAQYAIDNLQADYKYNALMKAQDYSQTMNMSRDRIYEQLTSEYGEMFTAEEAQYAIDNMK